MHLLIGLLLGIVLLYFWLLGHWFARVLVFLPLAVVGFVAGGEIAAGYGEEWAAAHRPQVVAAPETHKPGGATVEEVLATLERRAPAPQAAAQAVAAPASPLWFLPFGVVPGVLLAWLIASLPIYYWRAQLKRADPELYAVLRPRSIKDWLLSPPGS